MWRRRTSYSFERDRAERPIWRKVSTGALCRARTRVGGWGQGGQAFHVAEERGGAQRAIASHFARDRWPANFQIQTLTGPQRTYIIEERKGQGAKPKTVTTSSPPLPAPHRRLRRSFPPRQGEKTALGRFLGEKRSTRGNFTLVQL